MTSIGNQTTAGARRAGLVALLLLLGLLGTALIGAGVFPAPASAAKCLDCEGEEEPPIEEEEPPVEEELLSYTLTIHINGIGAVKEGSTTYCQSSTPAGNTCARQVLEGEVVTLTATPGGGMSFIGWGGECTVTAGACEVTMDEERSVAAGFADVTPPAVPTITSPTASQVFERTAEEPVEVVFDNSGDSSTVAYLCSLDVAFGGIPCSSPWETADLGAGPHTVYVWAKDAFGNTSSPASRSFEVVIAPPKEEGGSGTGSDGSGAGTTPTTEPKPLDVPPRLLPKLIMKWRFEGKETVFRKMTLKKLPAGAKVVVTCVDSSCPFKRKQPKVQNGVADLTPFFRGHALDPGSRIGLRITAPEARPFKATLETRAGKAPRALPIKLS